MTNYNKSNCCNNIKKTCHCCNPNPICTCQSFIQLYDRTLVNELTDSIRYLSLAKDNINVLQSGNSLLPLPNDQSFSSGGYTISTTTVKNDTLNLPGPGIYQISLRLITNALSNGGGPYLTNCAQLVYGVTFDGGGEYVMPTCMVLTADINSELINDIYLYTYYRGTGREPSLRVYLKEFDFNLVLENKVFVDNMILVVQKIQNL